MANHSPSEKTRYATAGGKMTSESAPATPKHEVAFRRDWMGDPDVINGTVSWDTPYCKVCGAEGEELDEKPCVQEQP